MKKQFLKTAFISLIISVLFVVGVNAQVGIGTTTPNTSAVLDLTTTTQGLLPPRMTQAQRNAIVTPAAGLMVWCTNCGTAGELQVYNGSTWTNIIGGTASAVVPDAPTSPVATAGNTQASVAFTVPAYNGGSAITGYTVTSSPGNFTATGVSSPLVVNGLTNGTAYTFTVVATNAVGNSSSAVSVAVTPLYCGSSVFFTYNGASVTYGTVSRAYGGSVGTKCWLDRNLGATQVATSSTDAASCGDLFQWGRGADGHQIRNSATSYDGTTTKPTNITSTGAWDGKFITFSAGTNRNDWVTTQTDNAWNAGTASAPIKTATDPCPSGYRLPTDTELEAERLSWGANNNATGAFTSPLKLPMAGVRDFRSAWGGSGGGIGSVGVYGYYWSSAVNSTNSRLLLFTGGGSYIDTNLRAFGFAVRCLKD